MYKSTARKNKMASGLDFPYHLASITLTSLSVKRGSTEREILENPVVLDIVGVNQFMTPGINVLLEARSTGNFRIELKMAFTAQFTLTPGVEEPNCASKFDIIEDQAYISTWPFVASTVFMLTAQMGVGPIFLRIPYEPDVKIKID